MDTDEYTGRPWASAMFVVLAFVAALLKSLLFAFLFVVLFALTIYPLAKEG